MDGPTVVIPAAPRDDPMDDPMAEAAGLLASEGVVCALEVARVNCPLLTMHCWPAG
jgi:hypothetical protein